jgi:transcription elongation factor Elf1
MWSQPDIVRMNADAEKSAPKLLKRMETARVAECEDCGKKFNVHDEDVFFSLYYDIFSDDPKGIVALCKEHADERYDSYFYCDECNRVVVNNYTWEMYSTEMDGGQVCLPCAAKMYLQDGSNWLKLTPEEIEMVGFNSLDVCKRYSVSKAPHLIGVDMPVPKSVKFVDNVEFDSMSGACISGGGLGEIKQKLTELMEQGIERAILILDAAYQFAVSIGIYVDA